MNEKIKISIEFIKNSIENDVAFVGFSGGKDSIVTAKLVELSGIKYKLFYSFTGIDAPEVVRFIRTEYPNCIFMRPKRTFWKNLSTNVPPSNRLRWCCTALKKVPSWKLPYKKRIFGIRAEENIKRSKQGKINFFQKLDHVHFHPIFDWKEFEVWEFIEKYNLKYPILYDWGFDRVGCVICPYHSEKTGKKHDKYRSHWPKYFELWEKSITNLFEKRQNQKKNMFYPTAKEFIDAWYLNNAARWYKIEEDYGV